MNITITILDDMTDIDGVDTPSDYIANILRNRQEYNQSLLTRARVAMETVFDDDKI